MEAAGAVVDRKTRGKHSDKIAKYGQKATDAVENFGRGGSQRRQARLGCAPSTWRRMLRVDAIAAKIDPLRRFSRKVGILRFLSGKTWTLAIAMASALGCMLVSTSEASTPSKVSKQTATKWMQGYLQAWETRDANAVVKLFTPNGIYQSIPGVSSQTFVGRKAIHKYWFDVTRPQSMIHGVQGQPIVTGNRAAIEIWVTFRDPVYNPKGKHMITLLETNVVTFVKSGLASKNVEYWNIIPGVHSPPPGWGK